MKSLFAIVGLTLVSGVLGVAAYNPVSDYWQAKNRPNYRLEKVARGKIVSAVNATGTVKPVLSVPVGSFVSGPVIELLVDFNDVVKKGDLLAKIDPRIYEANVARDRAGMITRQADVERARALLQLAINDEKRAQALKAENQDFISDTEIDQFHFNRVSLEAQVKVAEAYVEQAQANLDNSQANLEYTNIVSPVDGIVIDRKIDSGQTLAAQFQTPELFIIAPDMEKEMYVYASVDEADIGLIRLAQEREQPVIFTVDAYPDDVFQGTIHQIRKSSTTTQNVVTYPVVISAPNPDLKLMPGMTADILFRIEEKTAVLKVPNAALRFYPELEQVRAEDRPLLEGPATEDIAPALYDAAAGEDAANGDAANGDAANGDAANGDAANGDAANGDAANGDAANGDAAQPAGRLRHVWLIEGNLLRAVEVQEGISDNKYTELLSGDLQEGQELVTGILPKELAPKAPPEARPVNLWLTFRVALLALAKNKLRAGLTVLGVVIGIAAVTTMVSIGESAGALVQGQVQSLGTNVLIVFPAGQREGGVHRGVSQTLTPGDAQALAEECSAVLAASPIVAAAGQLIYGNANWAPREMVGVDVDFLLVRNWQLREGSFFTQRDVNSAAKVCVVGHTIVSQLFQTSNPLGRTIRIKNIPFRVIGVLEQKGANLFGQDQDDLVLLPYTSARKRLQGSAFDNVNGILLSARSELLVPEAQFQIEQLLLERHAIRPGQAPDFEIGSSQEIAGIMGIVTGTMTLLLAAIAGISLLVGGVGIMNIMLVSVTERTREIGIRMAVGARGRDILKQFLVESVLLSCVGGAIGVALGIGASVGVTLLINRFTSGSQWPIVVSLPAAGVAMIFAAAVGIFFGYYPARRASRLDPIDALRYE